MSRETRVLPPEWAPQVGAMLTWPRGGWRPVPLEIERVFLALARAIAARETVVIVCRDGEAASHVRALLRREGVPDGRFRLHAVSADDPWARDHGPVTALADGEPIVLDFSYAGRGGRQPTARAHAVPSRLHALGAFGAARLAVGPLALAGDIETDGLGTLLSAEPGLSPQGDEAAELPREVLGIDRVFGLRHGLVGHDGRAVSLARFCDPRTIAYQRCDDPAERCWSELQALAAAALRTRDGAPYELVPLPWPRPHFEVSAARSTATYAGFVILNQAVLVPTFDDPADAEAQARLAAAFPGRDVVGIDCRELIEHGGDLHAAVATLPQPLQLGPSTAL